MAGGKVSKRYHSAQRHSRNRVPLGFKWKVVQLFDEGVSATEISQKFNMPRSTVTTILKDKDRIMREVKSAASLDSTVIRRRDTLIGDMEKLLIIWIEDERAFGVPPSLAAIQAKAKSLFDSLNEERGAGSACVTFQASRGWFARFKNRYNLPSTKESVDADVEAASDFREALEEVIRKGDYSLEQIFCVHETGLYWKKMPSNTYIAKEERYMPGFKPAKDRFTLLLGSNAVGTFKLKPLVVYHRENPRALKEVDKRDLPVHWMSNSKACINSTILNEWCSHHFVSAIQKYLQSKNLSFRALLILDSGLQLEGIRVDRNIKVVHLPPNTATLLLPMDLGISSLFKAYYMRRIVEKAVLEAGEVDSFSLRKFWKSFNIADAVKVVAESWKEVKESNIRRAWTKSYPNIVPDVDGKDEDIVVDVIAAVVDMFRRLDVKVDPEDVRELLDSHSEELTHKDHLMLAELSEDEDLVVEEIHRPSTLTADRLSKAFKHLESAMAIFSEDPNVARSTIVNACILNSYSCYKEIYLEKRKASS